MSLHEILRSLLRVCCIFLQLHGHVLVTKQSLIASNGWVQVILVYLQPFKPFQYYMTCAQNSENSIFNSYSFEVSS